MPNRDRADPEWARGVADELQDCLRAAAALPIPAAAIADPEQAAGWYVTPPGGPVQGRTPWIHMSDIRVDCLGSAFVLSFTWKPDEPENAPRYLLPMTTLPADEVIASDALLTRLDFFLDTPWRDQHTVDLGHGVALVVMAE